MIASRITSQISSKIINYLPGFRGLRVLMYHQISDNKADALTVRQRDFEAQIHYLKNQAYNFISLNELHDCMLGKRQLPDKPVLLTFDDGYVNNLEYAYPILKKLAVKAAIFLPVGHLGTVNTWDGGNEKLMNFTELKSFDPKLVEFALHSYYHKNFNSMTFDEIEADLKLCMETLEHEQIPFEKSLAYPYGAFPKKQVKQLESTLERLGILSAFRIGNKININFHDRFFLNRVDIHGTDSLNVFKLKMKLGKIKF